MAKFCGNCGVRLEDNASICSRCGAPVDDIAQSMSGIQNVESGKKVKKIILLTLRLIAILAVIISGLTVASNFIGNKGLVHNVMAAYRNYDIDTLISLTSDLYYYIDENVIESYFEENIGNDHDYFEASVGHSYKISYAINEIYILSGRRQEEVYDELEESIEYQYPDLDVRSMIDRMAVADVTVTAKQGDKSVSQTIQIVMSKEEKDWKLLYLE